MEFFVAASINLFYVMRHMPGTFTLYAPRIGDKFDKEWHSVYSGPGDQVVFAVSPGLQYDTTILHKAAVARVELFSLN